MKKLIFFILAASMISFLSPAANAQMMGGFSNSSADWEKVVEHTFSEEKEGKELWNKFQAKEISCADFNDEQFGVLGEYFMGQITGQSHAAMNAMMIQMHGEDGEKQIHITMSKRLSGCDTSAVFPEISGRWMPMMQMMMGGLPDRHAGQSRLDFYGFRVDPDNRGDCRAYQMAYGPPPQNGQS